MIRLRRSARVLRGLSWPERVAVVESTLLFWWFSIALKVVPFRSFKRVLGPPGTKDDPAALTSTNAVGDDVQMVTRSVQRIARRHPDTCLAQALAARVMMRRRAQPSRLSLAVRTDGAARAFHAWLAQNDCVVSGGDQLEAFSVIATFTDQARHQDR